MPSRDDDLDLTLAGTWRRDGDLTLERWTLRSGGKSYELWTDRPTADALFALLAALPSAVARLQRERDGLAHEVEKLTDANAEVTRTAKAKAEPARPVLAAVPRSITKSGGASLADVPLAMIGTFRADDPRVKAAAKKDPLMALAVQVAKALAPDASELDQARLRAMATAVSRGDLDTFWSASTERSRKKLGG